MTDRYHALTVVLDRDIREDDAEPILAAIQMIKGVQSVTPHVADLGEHVARERIRIEIGQKIWNILYPKAGE